MSYTKSTFGLDIGDRSLKVLQLASHHGNNVLAGFHETPLPPGLVTDGVILNAPALSNAIKNALRAARIPSKAAIVALPEAKTYTRLLQLHYDGGPVRDLVAQALVQHIPFSLEEVWWDFAVIAQHDLQVRVLVGAAPKTLTASYTELLEHSDITPIALDLESLAIARATIKSGTTAGCSMIVDLGAAKSTLIVANPETVISTADAKSDGDVLTGALTERLKITPEAAEEMKLQKGIFEDTSEYSAIVKEYVGRLALRIKTVLGHLLTQETFCPAPGEILLTGGGSLLKGLPEALTKELSMPVRLGNPWVNIKTTLTPPLPPEVSARLATACGLALHALENSHV